MGGIKGKHLVRYGYAGDQKHLVGKVLNTYDQLVFNARIVSHMGGGIAVFRSRDALNMPYFIDPETHAFQHDISNLQSNSTQSTGSLKRSIVNLLNAYGDPVRRVVMEENRSILPEDFGNAELTKGFCNRVIDFQMNSLPNNAERNATKKYYSFLNKKLKKGYRFIPELVVAPYFFMEGNTFDNWVSVNIACARQSIELARKKKIPIGVQIVISQKVLLNPSQIEELISRYADLKGADVFLIWIDSLSEHKASRDLLESFVELARQLGKTAPVVNLYGGFFSVLLCHANILKAVAHGLDYGEYRSVTPVGGGISTAKYYFPATHSRLLFREALRGARKLGGMASVAEFHSHLCDCDQCRKVISNNPNDDFAEYGRTRQGKDGRPYPTQETKDNCIQHYMWCKAKEYKQNTDVKRSLKEMTDACSALRGVIGTSHCYVWGNAISKVI